jgi:hypothetical protein
MEMEQMLASLLKEMKDEIKEVMEAKQKEKKAQIKAIQEKMDAAHEEMMADMRTWRKEMKASQEMMEAPLECKGSTLEGRESGMVLREVPKEEAAVKSLRSLRKRQGDWHLATKCCQKLKEWTQGNCGSQRNLAATRRGMTCYRGHVRKGHDWDKVVQETWKSRTFGRTCQLKLECSNGIRSRNVKELLRLRKTADSI